MRLLTSSFEAVKVGAKRNSPLTKGAAPKARGLS